MNSLKMKLSTFYCWLFYVAFLAPPVLHGVQPLLFEEGFRELSSSWNVALGDFD